MSPLTQHSFVPFLSIFSLILIVFLCVIVFSIVASFAIIFIIYAVCQFLIGPSALNDPWHDIESGGGGAEISQINQIAGGGSRIYVSHRPQGGGVDGVRNNMWLEFLERTMEAIEERRRGKKKMAMEKMPEPVMYGSSAMAAKCIDCAICLEDFGGEELCQIFPVCNHIFHPNCILHWLKKNVTCPICRCSIVDDDDGDDDR